MTVVEFWAKYGELLSDFENLDRDDVALVVTKILQSVTPLIGIPEERDV